MNFKTKSQIARKWTRAWADKKKTEINPRTKVVIETSVINIFGENKMIWLFQQTPFDIVTFCSVGGFVAIRMHICDFTNETRMDPKRARYTVKPTTLFQLKPLLLLVVPPLVDASASVCERMNWRIGEGKDYRQFLRS